MGDCDASEEESRREGKNSSVLGTTDTRVMHRETLWEAGSWRMRNRLYLPRESQGRLSSASGGSPASRFPSIVTSYFEKLNSLNFNQIYI